jgi:transcriptional regulator with XRE-family HTH domain
MMETMRETMSGAEMAATRHLLGLSQAELAEALRVSRYAVRDWESGKLSVVPGVVRELGALRAQHDLALRRLLPAAREGVPIELGHEPRPRGWYLALGARVIAAVPDAELSWR